MMEPFKNLFNPESAKKISTAIKRGYLKFDSASFLKNIKSNLDPLELKERVDYLANQLYLHLPKDPKKSIPILVKALKQSEKDQVGVVQFLVWPLAHYISLHGLNDFELSMDALKEITKLFTSEFAVRAFFIKDQQKTLRQFKEWVKDENEHVRRLVSEGSRPLLPWGQKLHGFVIEPELTWKLLEKLKDDQSEYVRKSVANHINDHSKNHPDYVIEKLLMWHKSKNMTPELAWIIRHASRTLIKKGYTKAFLLHGIEDSKIKVIKQEIVNDLVKIGESLKVIVTLKNLESINATIILDHEMHLLKASQKHGLKVFKGKKIILLPKQLMKVEMTIPLKLVTTRIYYPGKQLWNIKVNGVSQKPIEFTLKIK